MNWGKAFPSCSGLIQLASSVAGEQGQAVSGSVTSCREAGRVCPAQVLTRPLPSGAPHGGQEQFLFVFTYLKVRVTRLRGTERESPAASPLPRWPGPDQAEARSFPQVSHMGAGVHTVGLPPLSWVISRELERKGSSQDADWCPVGCLLCPSAGSFQARWPLTEQGCQRQCQPGTQLWEGEGSLAKVRLGPGPLGL